MKKILSIALAVMMIFTLSISAFAKGVYEFEDTKDVATNKDTRDYIDSNKYFEDALQLMVDLEIITGRTDGSLDPSAPVNRLEFIVMLYKLLNRGREASELFATQHPFTDGSWGSKYVGWAYTSDITAGVSDTLFGSTNRIKYVDALAFLVKALGVNPDFEKNWANDYESAATLIGNELDLIRDFAAVDAKSLTRAECAVLFYFATEAKTQTYTSVGSGDNITYQRKPEDTNALQKFYGYKRYEGQVVANQAVALDGSIPKAGKGVVKMGDVFVTVPVNFPVEKLGYGFYFYAPSVSFGDNKAHEFTTVIGSNYATTTDNSYGVGDAYYVGNATAGSAGTLYSKGDAANVDNRVGSDGSVTSSNVYVNYSKVDITKKSTDGTAVGSGKLNAIADTPVNGLLSGNVVRYVKYGDNEYFFIESLTAAKISRIRDNTGVTAANASGTGNFFASIKAENIICDEDYAVDDYFVGMKVGDYYYIKLADEIASKYTSVTNKKFKIDSKDYSQYDIAGAKEFFDASGSATITRNAEYTFYAVDNKLIAAVGKGGTTTTTGNNYAYIRSHVASGIGDAAIHQVSVYSAADKGGKVYQVSSASTGYGKSHTGTDNNFSMSGDLDGQVRKYSIVDGMIVLEGQPGSADLTGTVLEAYGGSAVTYKPKDGGSDPTYALNAGSVFFFINNNGSCTVAVNKPTGFGQQTVQGYEFWAADNKTGNFDNLMLAVIRNGSVNNGGNFNFNKSYSHFYVWGATDPLANAADDGTFTAFNGSSLATYTITDKTSYNGGSMNAGGITTKNKLLRLSTENGELINVADATPKTTDYGTDDEKKTFTGDSRNSHKSKYAYFVSTNGHFNADGAGTSADQLSFRYAQFNTTDSKHYAGAYQVNVDSIDSGSGIINILTTTATNPGLIYLNNISNSMSFYMVDKDAAEGEQLKKVDAADVDLDIDGVEYTFYMVWTADDTDAGAPSAVYITYQED